MYKISNYPEIQNNFYLSGKNQGASLKLLGKVAIISVFVSRRPTDWSESTKNQYYTCINDSISFLSKEAWRYGAPLEIKGYHVDATVPADANPKKGFQLFKNFFHTETMLETQKYYERTLGVNEAIILFVFNENGRSFAFEDKGSHFAKVDEASVIFFSPETHSHTSFTISHEVLHQFGAVDYYYPAEVMNLAKQYFKSSVMGLGGMVVDDLTAYLIGWKETISAETYWFLRNTMFMTPEKWAKSVDDEWKRKW